ncbi:trehalose-phosphatase [Caulobacter rhizosphaerae]|jgi:trehalose 6-phosphate phosphatase|uniref:trehalose-phosphatase n=1 Tax=Caulobacter rhizosphaerae TaxID=2010972 RepID=UPI0013D2A25B|nr:trehalose-phosphatase [Caulobacter rhizosphaerae]
MTAFRSVVRHAPSDLPPPPLALPPRAALFLDLDGTLAPIMPRPEQVGPDARRAALLDALSRALEGRLAVVSGRALEDVDRILEGRVRFVAAVHGLVRRGGNGVDRLPPHPDLHHARDVLRDLARGDRGLLFEDKDLSVALHYRNVPSAADAVIEAAERLARGSELVLQLGDMVAELRTPGQDKGKAVTAFLREAPFDGATPVFVGDDLTDEDGFAAAARLGGYGVLVGPSHRPTQATYRLNDFNAVLDWLSASIGRAAA